MGRPRRCNYAEARAAWFGAATADAIADRLRISVAWLHAVWASMRKSGELPNVDRYQYRLRTLGVVAGGEAFAHDAAGDSDDADDDDGFPPGDGRPSLGEFDPLLDALKREHGDDPRRRRDDLTAVLAGVRRECRSGVARATVAAPRFT